MPFSSPNSNQARTFTELLLHAWQSAAFARTFRKPHSHSNVNTLLVLQTEKPRLSVAKPLTRGTS